MVTEVGPGELEAGSTLALLTAPQTPDDGVHPVPAGVVLGGRLVVERLLGVGGMGSVVLARHRELGEPRAIKLLRPDRMTNAESRHRLIREARAAAQLQGAHVVRVFDVVSEGPYAPYLVMEYLIGETLAARLARGPLTASAAAAIVIETSEALAEAHRAGTIHRDLKPSNLFLVARDGRDDFVKVLDFGIAKTQESRLADWTHSDALLASPPYASPEQLRASKDVDARSDIWSLGVILYECLAGRRPFGGDTLPELSSRILRDDPPPLRMFRPDVPGALDRAVNRCLRKRREERFPDVAALLDALAPFAPTAASASRIKALLSAPTVARATPAEWGDGSDGQSATLTFASVVRALTVPGRHRSLVRRPLFGLMAVGLVVAALGAATGLGWLGRETAPAGDDTVHVQAAAGAPPMGGAEPSAPVMSGAAAMHATPTGSATPTPVPTAPPVAVIDRASRGDRDAARARRAGRPRPETAAAATIPVPAREDRRRSATIPVDELPLDELIDGRK